MLQNYYKEKLNIRSMSDKRFAILLEPCTEKLFYFLIKPFNSNGFLRGQHSAGDYYCIVTTHIINKLRIEINKNFVSNIDENRI